MQKKGEICEYRYKLDKTLSSPELTNHESLKSLLRDQLCSSQECNENILDKRTADVSKLLSKLRSVSMTDHQVSKLTNDASSYGGWKLKHDYEDCRVMYREGLEGSPFHTLLVEGYMDGPIEDCLCVSWESTLYTKWWPQFSFPPFRILKSTCLQKIGIGEQICFARMKVPWPLTDREIIVHYFLFEYFKDGLVIILLKSISDLDSIGVSSKDVVIPESTDAVRIDLVGGFVLQKVTPQRSYFRTIADLDIKLDLMPPSLINFISRQLIGNGFRLYKKSVASVAKFDEDYCRALTDPLYTKIRQALYSTAKEIEEEPKLEANEMNGDSLRKNEHENNGDASENELVHCRRTIPEIEEEPKLEANEMNGDSLRKNEHENNGDASENELVHCRRTIPEIEEEPKLEANEMNGDSLRKNEHENNGDASENEPVHCRRTVPEIEEEEEEEDFEESISSEEGNVIAKTDQVDIRRRFCISPEVEQALGTLDRVIFMVRNITPVQEDEELSPNRAEDQAKQVSVLENIDRIAQRSQRQDFSTSTVIQEEETSEFSREVKRENETGQKNGILNKSNKSKRKRKVRCFAFRSWL